MTTMEIKARKMDAVEALMQLDNDTFVKAEKYIQKLLNQSQNKTYEMPENLLNILLDKAEENRKKGLTISEQDMNNYIDSL